MAGVVQPEGDVLLDCQMREQRVVLKHESDVAQLRTQIDAARGIEQDTLANLDASLVGFHQPGDALHRETLTRPRGTEYHSGVVLGLEASVQLELPAVRAQRLANVDADLHVNTPA